MSFKGNILTSKNIIPPVEKVYMEIRTYNKYIQIHWELTFPVKMTVKANVCSEKWSSWPDISVDQPLF